MNITTINNQYLNISLPSYKTCFYEIYSQNGTFQSQKIFAKSNNYNIIIPYDPCDYYFIKIITDNNKHITFFPRKTDWDITPIDDELFHNRPSSGLLKNKFD